MSQADESFFTVIGCMDGRVQEATTTFGKEKFKAKYPDKISDAGFVKMIAQNQDPEYFDDLKEKLLLSINVHGSKGIIVDGHQDCAGNPTDDATHKKDIQRAVEFIKEFTSNKVPVIGVFVKKDKGEWAPEELA